MTITRDGILKHEAVFDAWLAGAEVEWNWNGTGWIDLDIPEWLSCNEYRIKATPDSINWDHVAPEFKWMARDLDGDVELSKTKPEIFGMNNTWSHTKGFNRSAKQFASYKRGTCDWKDSLVSRPNDE